MSKLSCFAGVGLSLVALACGSKETPAQSPSALAATASASTGQPGVQASGVPAQPVAAATTANILAPVEPALQQVAAGFLAQAAAEDAPGAKAVDMPRIAILAPGQSVEQTVNLQAGKCYTAIAVGLMPIAELNIQFLPAMAGLNVPLAQDTTTGPRAVLGKGKGCFQPPLGVSGPVRVVTTAATGNGLVAVQVFEK